MKIGINDFLDIFYSVLNNDEINSINMGDIIEIIKMMFSSDEFKIVSERININEFSEENVEKQLKISTFKIISNTIKDLHSIPMFCIKYSMPYSKAIWYQYGIMADDVMFMITCTTTSENDKKSEQEFNKIVNSFSK